MPCYIWNPYIIPEYPDCIEFILTMPNTNYLAQGTEDFIRQLIKDIGVTTNIISWFIKPCRCNYFSNILDEPGWYNVWKRIWKFYVILDNETELLPYSDLPYIVSDADRNQMFCPGYDPVVNCLIISDFNNGNKCQEAINILSNDGLIDHLRTQMGLGMPTFRTYNHHQKGVQLHIDLGIVSETFFVNGAGYALHVLEVCKRKGGFVYFRPFKRIQR